MQFCATCGRPREGNGRSCRGCGRPFDQGRSRPPRERNAPAGPEQDGGPTPTPPRTSSRPAVLAALAIGVLVVGAGAAVWLTHRPAPAQNGAAAGDVTSPASLATSAVTAASTGSAPTSAPPTPAGGTSSGGGSVHVAAAAAQSPDAQSVAAFLDSYFTAINTHDYQAYSALLTSAQAQGLTQATFNRGYRGTADSAVSLVNISPAADGDTAATVTFTSHQNPDQANNEEACTDWRISLFLTPSGNSYLIDRPPAGYHAASAPCS
jgi:hypothetical protein